METGGLDVNMVKGFADQGAGRMELRAQVFSTPEWHGSPRWRTSPSPPYTFWV